MQKRKQFTLGIITLLLLCILAGCQLIIELKDKLNLEDLESVSMKEETGASLQAGDGDSISDTVQALTALGYSNGEAYRAVRGVSDADAMDAEQLLKEALKIILTFS